MAVPIHWLSKDFIGSVFLGLIASAPAADLGQRSKCTPYDRYFGRLFAVLEGTGAAPAPPAQVMAKMKDARRIRHQYDPREPYIPQTPLITERRRVGDCKAKALWLIQELNDPRARFVVGKYRGARTKNHAWVLWSDGSHWWVLDPTFHDRPVSIGETRSEKWEPHYSYDKRGRYVHGGVSQAPDFNARIAVAGNARSGSTRR
jgi:hypothetical protein